MVVWYDLLFLLTIQQTIYIIHESSPKLSDKLQALLPNGLLGDLQLHHLMLSVQDLLLGPQQPHGQQAVLEADHHILNVIHVVPKVDDIIDLSELLDDDEHLPGERKVPRRGH